MENMEKHNGKNQRSLLWLCVISMVLSGAAIVLSLIALQGNNNASELPTVMVYNTPDGSKDEGTAAEELPGQQSLRIESLEEQGDSVLVTTSYGTLKYPYAFSDIIQVEAAATQGDQRLRFTAKISRYESRLFDICFHSGEGTLLGSLQVQGETVPVSIVLYEADAALEGEFLTTFHAAQEQINEICVSLEENEGFVRAN